MPLAKIEKLTPEQEALIPVCREKWRRIALSVEPIDRSLAADAVIAAYALLGLSQPKIIFYDSPYAAMKSAIPIILNKLDEDELQSRLHFGLLDKLRKQIGDGSFNLLIERLESEFSQELYEPLAYDLLDPLWLELERRLWQDFSENLWLKLEILWENNITPQSEAMEIALLDVFISILNCACDLQTWEVYQSVVRHCNWIFPFGQVCFVCDRPRIIALDSQYRLHAEDSPAIKFAAVALDRAGENRERVNRGPLIKGFRAN